MDSALTRRGFLKTAAMGCAVCAGCSGSKWPSLSPGPASVSSGVPGFISPGCRGTKVRVGLVYAAAPEGKGLWPTPKLDLAAEKARYDLFLAHQKELSDVEFVGSQLVTSVDQAQAAAKGLGDVDGILVVHLSMGIQQMLQEFLTAKKPTVLFAAPYSGHEWTSYGATEKANPLFDCMLTSDMRGLVAAVRPFRAMHHLREAKIVNVTERPWAAEAIKAINDKWGTQVVIVGRERMMQYYNAISEERARTEAADWTRRAIKVVEPSQEEVVKSCRLALAFEQLMNDERATAITTDCYGSMYRQLPAFPCVGNVRLNDMGLAGICESDLRCAMTHIIFQGLVGRPGFISDPTMDESKEAIILAHCLGSRKMDGPAGPMAPYKLRTIMERQEGCVPQVFMRVGEPVTQAILLGTDHVRYFTGTVIDAPDTDRGCRTKITVKIDGSPRKLWENWSDGLHRVTCYGNIKDDLGRFCKFNGIKMTDEAV